MNFSTPLGIAAVTYVLQQVLTNGLVHRKNQGASVIDIFNNVHVSIKTPDKLENNSEPQLNLFMYMASFNSGWRNQLNPVRNSGGARIENPPLAIDLHYVLSAYDHGTDIHRDVLLGFGMQVFHDNPVLSRSIINQVLTNTTPDYLSASNLDKQVEQIKISPETLTTEEISRLWSAFGAKYRPSVTYKVTVVLMQTQYDIEPGPPVRSRNIYVKPFKNPVIEKVIGIPNNAVNPDPGKAIVLGSQLSIQGNNLKGEIVEVRIGGHSQLINSGVTDKEIIAPAIPNTLKAGVQTVQVVHNIKMGSPEEVHMGTVSNAGFFLLAPTIYTQTPVTITGVPVNLTVTGISPLIEAGQKVYLLLNEIVPANVQLLPKSWQIKVPESKIVSTGTTSSFTINIPAIDPGDYKVRLSVDNAESE